MDPFEGDIDSQALTVLYEFLLSLPSTGRVNTSHIISSILDLLVDAGIEEHPALVIRQCLR